MPIPAPSGDDIVARLNANDRAMGRLALVLLSAALVLVAIYAAAYFSGEVMMVQSTGAQIAIGGLFVVAVGFAFLGFARRIRPVAQSDANDPRIVRRRIDAHHRDWRLMLMSWLVMILGLLPTLTMAGRTLGALGHAYRPLAIAATAAMIAPIMLLSLLTIAGPGWGNRELRAILNDDFVRQLRARAIRLGYLTMLMTVSAGFLAAVWRPDLALQALGWSLCAGSAIPALYYVIADWRAGRES
jgi:hypothetical protein